MPRLYTEIRVSHSSIEAKQEFEAQLKQQAETLGADRTGYIKLIVKLDTATEIIKKLKEEK
ncbi:MAG TPA: hypothetical protein VIK78_19840 [Ruminiclostridium sp.]